MIYMLLLFYFQIPFFFLINLEIMQLGSRGSTPTWDLNSTPHALGSGALPLRSYALHVIHILNFFYKLNSGGILKKIKKLISG